MPLAQPLLPGYAARVYADSAIWVVSGANQGDPLGTADEVVLGDVYRLRPDAAVHRLVLCPTDGSGQQIIDQGSEVGTPGSPVRLLSALTLMPPDGDRVEVLLVGLADGARLVLPLSPMTPRTDYTLIAARADPGDLRVAEIVCVSFAAGTRITLPGGAQKAIETLRPGELVLTRDSGPQPVRWVGRATLRAIGSFAPVVIGAGVLGNSADLVVSPHHRVFLYQRGARRIGNSAEILIQAKHLVDGDRVRRREGGFVDYYSLIFDRHEIIYAEGIAAESLMVNETTLTILPEEIAADVRARFPGLSQSPHFGTEIGRSALDEFGRDGLFRKPKI